MPTLEDEDVNSIWGFRFSYIEALSNYPTPKAITEEMVITAMLIFPLCDASFRTGREET